MNRIERTKVEKVWREGYKVYVTKDLYLFCDEDLRKGEFTIWDAYKEFNPVNYILYSDFVNAILESKIKIV